MAFAKMVQKMKKTTGNLKLVLLGLDNAGKTTLIMKYFAVDGLVCPTVGYQIFTVPWKIQIRESNRDTGCHDSCKIEEITIMDIGGQHEFKKYWNCYFEETDGIIFVIDPTDQRYFSEYLRDALLLGIPTAIFVNKADMIENYNTEEIERDIKQENAKVFKCTAKRNEGIAEGIDWLIKSILMAEQD